MLYPQLPDNELAVLADKIVPLFRKKKFTFVFLYSFFIMYFSTPSFQIPLLEYCGFRITSLMEQRAIRKNLKYFPKQSWININNVNPNLLKAILSLEDETYFTHKGIDWRQLDKSLTANKRRGRIIRGASTITMQLAKNLYLTTERNFFRKAKELIITFRMEKELSKKTILQDYVNAVEWGNGVFGIREASKFYFHKEPGKLTKEECARLAAVIPSPLKHTPNSSSAFVLRRTSLALKRMNNIILFPGN